MEDKKTNYETKTYDIIKASMIAFPIGLSCVFILLITGLHYHLNKISAIGLVLIFTIPFLFKQKFIQRFTYKTILTFTKTGFTIKKINYSNEEELIEGQVDWKDINFYKCSLSFSGITNIVIYLKDGKRKNLSFKEDKNQEQTMKEQSAFSLFYHFISAYNLNQSINEHINYKPGYLTTKNGLVMLVIFLIGTMAAIIIQLNFNPKSSILSFTGLFIILNLFAKRKKENLFNEKISTLKPIDL